MIVLILIRKSIVSLRRHLERVTDRLPVYHDDEEVMSTNSATSPSHHHKDTSVDNVVNNGGLNRPPEDNEEGGSDDDEYEVPWVCFGHVLWDVITSQARFVVCFSCGNLMGVLWLFWAI